jgi:tRNA nucleotidyltransferase (CCA-adding enzyme)
MQTTKQQKPRFRVVLVGIPSRSKKSWLLHDHDWQLFAILSKDVVERSLQSNMTATIQACLPDAATEETEQ